MSLSDIFTLYSHSKLWTETYHVDAVKLFLSSEITRLGLIKEASFPINERDIANALQVSRQTVNRAWHELATDGVVTIKQGVGVVVKDPQLLSLGVASVEAYFEIRRQSEIQIACLAVEKSTQATLDNLHAATEELTQAVNDFQQADFTSADSLLERDALIFAIFLKDVGFHAALRQIAQDPWLEIICEIAETKTQTVRYTALTAQGRPLSELVDVHWEIFKAIEARNENKTTQAVEKYFQVTKM